MDCVTDQLKKSELGRLVLDGLLRDVVNKRRELYERLENANAPKDGGKGEQQEEKPAENEAPQVSIDTAPPQAAPATTTEVGYQI